mmetsp:Transcript_49816/g.146915  ORF Transcript_49816/g.146915 Transcript_49816/m.146915 type:complete len:128 (-) Transcript_49816:324-707(-)
MHKWRNSEQTVSPRSHMHVGRRCRLQHLSCAFDIQTWSEPFATGQLSEQAARLVLTQQTQSSPRSFRLASASANVLRMSRNWYPGSSWSLLEKSKREQRASSPPTFSNGGIGGQSSFTTVKMSLKCQ